MKLIYKLVVVCLCLFASAVSNAQCETIVTISDADTGVVYQEIHNNAPTTPSYYTVDCVPSNEPRLRIQIMSTCNDCPARFDTTSIHGGNAIYVPGTAVYNGLYIVEFQVDVVGGMNSFTLTGTQGNCLHLKASVTFCPPVDPEEPCMTCPEPCPKCPVITNDCLPYEIKGCCEMECIKFNLRKKECEGCYLISVLLEDGSIETINTNLTFGESAMNCYNKKIIRVLSIAPYACPNPCDTKPAKKEVIRQSKAEKAESHTQDKVRLAPNPVKTVLNFEVDRLDVYTFTLFDFNGEKVMSQLLTGDSVNLQKFNRGTYIYTITDQQGYKQTGQLVKE